mmetsp:Transcript_147081/g.259300  ORF Transcript_147081/g.259300 Transcript_147081/m.259300 type:complete len:255 (+) Transcript_147081:137-901(+)
MLTTAAMTRTWCRLSPCRCHEARLCSIITKSVSAHVMCYPSAPLPFQQRSEESIWGTRVLASRQFSHALTGLALCLEPSNSASGHQDPSRTSLHSSPQSGFLRCQMHPTAHSRPQDPARSSSFHFVQSFKLMTTTPTSSPKPSTRWCFCLCGGSGVWKSMVLLRTWRRALQLLFRAVLTWHASGAPRSRVETPEASLWFSLWKSLCHGQWLKALTVEVSLQHPCWWLSLRSQTACYCPSVQGCLCPRLLVFHSS